MEKKTKEKTVNFCENCYHFEVCKMITKCKETEKPQSCYQKKIDSNKFGG